MFFGFQSISWQIFRLQSENILSCFNTIGAELGWETSDYGLLFKFTEVKCDFGFLLSIHVSTDVEARIMELGIMLHRHAP